MNKNIPSSNDKPNTYKIADKASSKLTFKGVSSGRRIHTEAYDPIEEEQKPVNDKFQFSLANYKNYFPSRSSKKSNPPSYLDYKKISQPSTLGSNNEMTSTLSKNTGLKTSKDVGEIFKLGLGSKGLTGKNEDYRKHGRIKT